MSPLGFEELTYSAFRSISVDILYLGDIHYTIRVGCVLEPITVLVLCFLCFILLQPLASELSMAHNVVNSSG
jgi:hypothetical protein